MVFSRYIWTIVALVAVIVVTSVFLGIYLQKPEFPVTRSLLIALLVLETIALVFYITRIRKDLLRLVNALSNDDPTLQFSSKVKDPYFSAIHHGFNEIIRDFRLVRLDKEAEQRFFEATVNHVQFGLLAFDNSGQVRMVNDACLRLFRVEELNNVQEVNNISEELAGVFKKLSSERELLKKISIKGIQYHLIFLVSRFTLREEEIMLISIRDISREIDRNELEAWQKLLRLLRHEILNSITPIKLLAANLSEILEKERGTSPHLELSGEELEHLRTGLDTIHRRSTSLSNFLDAYSNLYRMPELKIKQVDGGTLLERVATLFKEQLTEDKIILQIEPPPDKLVFSLDERMIEQVMINLVKNAIQAVKSTSKKNIILAATCIDEKPAMLVKDSGSGIPEEQLDSIFLPFFSTQSEGTGIGLSFSQHVMRLHNGYINVVSKPGDGSEFQLLFPNRD
jgi:nitrogen fixation/metabolism regulation signal transduction histidine kinase